ncbi:MAG: hypothetical protein FWG56_09420, partial [Desulfovibrionaceae bacterium]|nr:hypothetical protein [Desulfovibrionaceae bacterium]
MFKKSSKGLLLKRATRARLGGGGAIDLVKHVLGLNFVQAVKNWRPRLWLQLDSGHAKRLVEPLRKSRQQVHALVKNRHDQSGRVFAQQT